MHLPWTWLGACLIVLSMPYSWQQTNYYTITMPKQIQANSVYIVSATYHGFPGSSSTEKLNLKVNIAKSGSTTGTSKEDVSNSTAISPGSTINLPINIGAFSPGSYVVKATLSGPISEERSQYVTLGSKTVSTFIQTDKAWYQPSQRVQFRVLLVKPDLGAFQGETLTVKIKDPQDNIIEQWDDAPRDHGVFQESLQLSDQPVMGDWKIISQIGEDDSNTDKTAQSTFTVKEYVLPQFEVTVSTPYVTYSSPAFTITVTAKYTFGGPVNGNLSLSLEMPYCPMITNCRPNPVEYKIPNFEGSAQVTVKPSDLYNGSPSPQPASKIAASDAKMVVMPRPPPVTDSLRDAPINVVAVVTEGLTGIQRNQTTTMTVYATDQKLTLSQAANFKPGLPFEVTVKLTRADGQPIVDTGSEPVSIQTNFDATPRSSALQNGVAVFTILPPLTQTTSLTITATYKTLQTAATVTAVKAVTGSTKYITINVKTKAPIVGKNIDIEVQTTFRMQAPLSCVVVGRGNIRTSGSQTDIGQSTATFSFPVTSLMTPHARIVCYYIDPTGEMIADSLDINVGGTFRTTVSMTTSNDSLEPGRNVTLTVKTQPDSLVAVSGVDMSVLLLQSGNDITQGKVFDELQKYDSFGNDVVFNNDFFVIGFWRRPFYGGSFQQIFEYAGVYLLTNGHYYVSPPPKRIWLEMARPMAMGMAMNDVARFEKTAMVDSPIEEESDTETMVEPTRVRTDFPETFIWALQNTTSDGSVTLTYTVPDTITTWIISCFAMNNMNGLGIMDQSKNITVYRKFFIVINLPYSVVNKEIINLQIIVFNYDLNPQNVTVTLSNDKDEYIITNKQEATTKTTNKQSVNTKQAKANGATSFSFQIQPIKVGPINLNVTARSPIAADAIIKQLLVKAEGSTEFFNKAVVIDLRTNHTFSTKVQLSIPKDAIPDSEYIEFAAIGDFMAPVIGNIKELIRMPSGCGEQNMINFVPDVVALIYLNRTRALTPDMEATLLDYLRQGYQRELTYKRKDKSFSAFGNSDSAGSTWLTAFVLKSFEMAEPYITIDEKETYEAKQYLKSQQNSDGEFKESGKIIHTSLQGGTTAKATLTAFVLIAFIENGSPVSSEFQQTIKNAVTYLENLLESITSSYDMAIVCYALQLAPDSQKKNRAFELLEKMKQREGDLVYWKSSITKPSGSYSYYDGPTSYDVETTAYALMSYTVRGLTDECLPIIRWMISKRSSLGGYSSSQDTVIGIQSLTAAGVSFQGTPDSTMNITIKFDGKSQSYTMNKKNALVTQKTPLPKTVRTVEIEASGSGTAIGQVSWNYNVYNKDPKPAFKITSIIKPTSKQRYTLTVCASNDGTGTNNMILIRMNTLSSYTWEESSLPTSNSQPLLKRSELDNGGTRATVYFDSFPSSGSDTCVTANAISTGDVTNLQDAEISVVDYYLPYRRRDAYYNLPKPV